MNAFSELDADHSEEKGMSPFVSFIGDRISEHSEWLLDQMERSTYIRGQSCQPVKCCQTLRWKASLLLRRTLPVSEVLHRYISNFSLFLTLSFLLTFNHKTLLKMGRMLTCLTITAYLAFIGKPEKIFLHICSQHFPNLLF